jgi:hypothetical protein
MMSSIWLEEDSTPETIKIKIRKALIKYRGIKQTSKTTFNTNQLRRGSFLLSADAAFAADELVKAREAVRIHSAPVPNFKSEVEWADARAAEIQARNLSEYTDGVGSIDKMKAHIQEWVEASL